MTDVYTFGDYDLFGLALLVFSLGVLFGYFAVIISARVRTIQAEEKRASSWARVEMDAELARLRRRNETSRATPLPGTRRA